MEGREVMKKKIFNVFECNVMKEYNHGRDVNIDELLRLKEVEIEEDLLKIRTSNKFVVHYMENYAREISEASISGKKCYSYFYNMEENINNETMKITIKEWDNSIYTYKTYDCIIDTIELTPSNNNTITLKILNIL